MIYQEVLTGGNNGFTAPGTLCPEGTAGLSFLYRRFMRALPGVGLPDQTVKRYICRQESPSVPSASAASATP